MRDRAAGPPAGVARFLVGLEDRHIWFAWVGWTGALAPLVKGSSEADC
jgi:hypothetical protein